MVKTYLNNGAPAKSRGEKLKWFLGYSKKYYVLSEIYEYLCVICTGGGRAGRIRTRNNSPLAI